MVGSLLFACGLASTADGQTNACLPRDDDALRLLGFARDLASATDAAESKVRTNVGLTLIDTTKVVRESDARACANAIAGINTDLNTPGQARAIHLVKLSTQGYLAFVPALAGAFPGSEYNPIFVLTKSGAVRTKILAF
ncbi:MAG: hypothetical protein V4813_06665 [Gemmatimonadota bacterium]